MIKLFKNIFKKNKNNSKNNSNIDYWNNLNDEDLSNTVMRKLLESNGETNFKSSVKYVFDESQLPENPNHGEIVYIISNNKIFIYTISGWTGISF